MNNENYQDKIAKIYKLVNEGATDGEKVAAKAALDRLMRKYNLDESYLHTIHLKFYSFAYQTNLDLMLFLQLVEFYFKDKGYTGYKQTTGGKRIVYKLDYLDYIQLDCSYAYFRSHLKKQFQKHCLPYISRCRTTKTKNEKRSQLQNSFFGSYVMKSKIYRDEQISQVDNSKLTDAQRKIYGIVSNVEGGNYNNQVTTGLYLEA